jgi:hypothetical protein
MKGLIVLIMAGMLLVSVVADIPIEGMKQYNYQYVINNSAEYPEYIFLTSSEIWGFDHPSIVVNGTFGGGYKLDGFVLHAMKEKSLYPTIKEQMGSDEQEKPDVTKFFDTAPVLTSDIMLPVSTTIDEKIPLTNLTVFLAIQEISDTGLNITREKTRYGYQNGTVWDQIGEEEPYDPQSGTPGA